MALPITIIQRGLRAAQPLATAVANGTLYYVTDEGVTEQSTGAAWVTYSDSGTFTAFNVSAGAASANLTKIVFSNSNGISFGLNGSTITGTVQTNYLTTAMASNRASDFVQATAAFAGTSASGTIASGGISVSIGPYITTAMASNRGTDFVQANAAFAGTSASGTIASNGISVSVGPYITTAMASNRGTDFVQASAAFAGTNASGTINSTGISVSVGAGGGILSYYQNAPFFQNTTVGLAFSSARLQVIPFILPQGISGGYLRSLYDGFLAQVAITGTSQTTTWSASHVFTFAIVIYTQGVVASSQSLRSIFSTSVGSTIQTVVTAGDTGSRYTFTYNITYPSVGLTNNTFTTTHATSITNYNFTTSILSDFTRLKWLDFPIATSFSPGNYWIGFGRSSSSDQNGPTAFTNTSQNYWSMSQVIQQQFALTVLPPGVTSHSSHIFEPGNGMVSTNAGVFSQDSLALSDFSARANNGQIYFQIIRQA